MGGRGEARNGGLDGCDELVRVMVQDLVEYRIVNIKCKLAIYIYINQII